MDFEFGGVKLALPLDPYQRSRYNKPVKEALELDVLEKLYHLTVGKCFDYINPTTNGFVSWRSIQSVDRDSKASFNEWK